MLQIKLASACPQNLECVNFTSTKRTDCEYLVSNGLSENEQEEVFCILWDQQYDFDSWQSTLIEEEPVDLSFNANQIETKNILIALKLLILGVMNYFFFSLSKSSLIIKWLAG